MRRFFTWWRRQKHERELFRQLRGMPDISPAHIETEVTALLRGLFHHDVVIQNRCLELLRKASSRRVAQALCSHLESGWPDSLPRRGAKTTKGYQKAVELLSGEQNQDTVEALIMLALTEQGSVREDALRVLKQVFAPHLVEHAMLVLLLREHELARFPARLTRYFVGTALAGLIVLVYVLAPFIILSPKVWAASFVFMCLGAGIFTWLQVSAVVHMLRDQRQVLLLLMKDFLEKQGVSTALREYATQRVDYLQQKLGG